MQFLNKNLVIVVVGCSNSGKSTFAIRYLEHGKFSCRFIFDPSGEYAEKFKRRPCTTPDELTASIPTGWVIFDPHGLFPGDPMEAFANFCEWAWHRSAGFPGQKILFADEVWRFCSPNLIPKPLAQIIQDGRKKGIGLIATTQRPNRLNESLIAEATELVGFRLTGVNAIEFLRRNCPEFPIDELPALPLLHYTAQNLQSGGLLRGILKF